jgi:ferrous iron transport protein B
MSSAPHGDRVVRRIVLIGNPNCGKTTLFNALTGLSAKTGNYPGITVEHRVGLARLADGLTVSVIDVPGTYSLVPRSDDEAVAVRVLLGDLPGQTRPDLVVAVVDATQLERNLYLVAQLRELPLPLIVALTMTDVIASDGGACDVAALQQRLAVPVVAAPAVAGGAFALKALLAAELTTPSRRLALNVARSDVDDPVVAAEVRRATDVADTVGRAMALRAGMAPEAAAAFGQLALQRSLTATETAMPIVDDSAPGLLAAVPAPLRAEAAARAVQARQQRARSWARDIVTQASAAEPRSLAFTRRLDAVALHPVAGPLLLVTVFGVLFQALFSWATPLMDLIDGLVGTASDAARAVLPQSMPLLSSLVTDGIIAGVGNVVVFVPQIAILFLFLAVLEDTGYLARAAFLLDRIMQGVGLHGRAFVPMLSGFACAVPAILATRTIENTKDRLVTILVTPLVSCSARLPVYALMVATVFAGVDPVFGIIEPGALVMVSMYTLSMVAAVAMAAIFKRTILRSPTPPLVLELPPYRVPRALQIYKAVSARVTTFLKEAGTVILAITVVLWGLLTFPIDHDVKDARDRAIKATELQLPAGAERDAELRAIRNGAGVALVEHSVAGRLGHAMEPFIAPLGFDWKIGIGIVASFAAREVFVSTLGIVYGLGEAQDESSTSLRDAMRHDTRPDGTPLYTPLSGLSLLVFFVLAMQCMSTLAAVKRETRSWRWPLFQFGYMTALALAASLLVYQVGRLLGVQ